MVTVSKRTLASPSPQTTLFSRSRKTPLPPQAAMHPVMLVYDLDQTEGPPPPEELYRFAQFEGQWDPQCLRKTVRNAAVHDHIRVSFEALSSTNAGFAELERGTGKWKMRIVIHNALDEPSR